MSEDNRKYHVLIGNSRADIENALNDYADMGYTLVEFFGTDDFMSSNYPYAFVAVMKRKEDPSADYHGMVDFMELPVDKVVGEMAFGSPLVRKALSEGWFVVGTFSGKVQLGRRRRDGE